MCMCCFYLFIYLYSYTLALYVSSSRLLLIVTKYSFSSSSSSSSSSSTCRLVVCERSFQAFLPFTIWLYFLSFSFFTPFIASFLSLFFVCPLVLNPMLFVSVILLTRFTSSILLICPSHFIFCATKYN